MITNTSIKIQESIILSAIFTFLKILSGNIFVGLFIIFKTGIYKNSHCILNKVSILNNIIIVDIIPVKMFVISVVK